MKVKTPKEIVEENLQGLQDIIGDPELYLFYMKLIEQCIEHHTEDTLREYKRRYRKYQKNGWKR